MMIGFMLKGDLGAYMSRLTMTALFSVGYLYLTTLMGLGMTDVIKMVNTVLQLKKQSTVKKSENPRMGEKGVFKR